MISRTILLMGSLALAVVIGACSEDKYGSLYCPEGPRDTLTVYPEPELLHVTILPDMNSGFDNDPGMAGMESLYLGSDGKTRSSILVNFDFAGIDTTMFPDSLFTFDNIRSVRLSLSKYRPYYPWNMETVAPTGAPLDLYYLVHQLEQTFDPDRYKTWPGPAAASLPGILNRDFNEPNDLNEPHLGLYPEDFLAWRSEGEVGMEIRLDDRSDPGLVGFASRETQRYRELDDLAAGTMVAPNLVVEFEDHFVEDNRFLLIPPVADTSTFEQVGDLPPDLIHVQTGLQAASILTFDVPPLPEGACLAGVGITLYPVEVDSLWTTRGACLVLASVDSTGLGLESGLVPVEDLDGELVEQGYLCQGTGDKSASPHVFPGLIQVMVQFPGTNLLMGRNPVEHAAGDLYFTQNTFYGPTGPEEFRPTLKLIYGKSGD